MTLVDIFRKNSREPMTQVSKTRLFLLFILISNFYNYVYSFVNYELEKEILKTVWCLTYMKSSH